MDKIVADYRRRFYKTPVKHWVIAACYALLTFANGHFRERYLLAAILGTVGFAALAAWSSLEIFVIMPLGFKKRMNALPEDERAAIGEQYGKAPALGERRFLDEYIIYYYAENIILVKYTDIRSAELKGYKLLLDIGRKKPLKMPFEPDENPAMIVAALRSKNPDISVKLNGRIIEKMENRKDNSK